MERGGASPQPVRASSPTRVALPPRLGGGGDDLREKIASREAGLAEGGLGFELSAQFTSALPPCQPRR